MTDKTSIGDRMKMYEKMETGRRFMPGLPVYARIDGRSFSKFTKGMNRPYDTDMSSAMWETTAYLIDQTNALIGYTQSDEISLVWYTDSFDSQIFFDGKIYKMTSVLAAPATAKFMELAMKIWPIKVAHSLPVFDARVFQLPSKMEASNVFLWREQDATKNAISMAGRSMFSHNELHKKNGNEIQEMMWQKGVNFNDYPAFFKRGTFLRRELVDIELSDEEWKSIPEQHRPESRIVKRHKIREIDMPIFSTVVNRVGVIFDGEEPLTNNP